VSIRVLQEHVLSQRRFAVLGASRDPENAGYRVYETLKSAGYVTYAINPNYDEVAGDICYPRLDNVPGPIDCVVTVTGPETTEDAMRAAGHLKIPFVWMQPGSESTAAYNLAISFAMQIVSGGPCIIDAIKHRTTLVATAA